MMFMINFFDIYIIHNGVHDFLIIRNPQLMMLLRGQFDINPYDLQYKPPKYLCRMETLCYFLRISEKGSLWLLLPFPHK